MFVVFPHQTTLQISLCAGIYLSHLNSNHAKIAFVFNGFHYTISAEYTNSYRVNESFFSPPCAQQKYNIFMYTTR